MFLDHISSASGATSFNHNFRYEDPDPSCTPFKVPRPSNRQKGCTYRKSEFNLEKKILAMDVRAACRCDKVGAEA